MKTITYLTLKKELEDHDYGFYGKYDIEHLFKVYTSLEFTKYSEFFEHNKFDFRDFVKENIEYFTIGVDRDSSGNISKHDSIALLNTANKLACDLGIINNSFMDYYRREQEDFVKVVEHYIGSNKPKILEVGSGRVPYSSIVLAQDFDNLTSMDRFILSDETLKNLNINPLDRYFNHPLDNVNDYDLVIGNKPCSAIESIVASCAVAKKPYFLKLCGCDAPHGLTKNWAPILKKHDPKIRFSKNYVFACNLDGNYQKFDKNFEIDSTKEL